MHPIERLRYVSRAGWAGPSVIAAEAAWALAALGDRETPALVTACRRLLEHQPGCGPLWWVSARVLSAGDPVAEAEFCAEALEDDPTEELLIDSLPQDARVVRHGGIAEVASADLVLVEVDALGAEQLVGDSVAESLLEAARVVEVPVWVAAGVGRVLPPRIWNALSARMSQGCATTAPIVRTSRALHGRRSFSVDSEAPPQEKLLAHRGVEKVATPHGTLSLATAMSLALECPEPPELLEAF